MACGSKIVNMVWPSPGSLHSPDDIEAKSASCRRSSEISQDIIMVLLQSLLTKSPGLLALPEMLTLAHVAASEKSSGL